MSLAQEKVTTSISQWLRKVCSQSFLIPLLVLLFLGFLFSPKGWVLSAIDHEIDQFQVHGELKNLKVTAIEMKLETWLGESFLTSSLEDIKLEVEALPWVHKATVSRVWPGKIVLNLTEQMPVAYWNENAFLNLEGDIFAPEEITKDRVLPLLVGPENSQQLLRAEMLAEMSQLQKMLEPYLLSAKRLEVNERGSWTMTLGNGIHVALGSKPFDSKVERLASVLNNASVEKQKEMESVDTRYPNGVAVKWKELALAASEKK